MDTGHPKTRLPHGGGIADLCLLRRDLPLHLPPDREPGGRHGSDPEHLFGRSPGHPHLQRKAGRLPHLAVPHCRQQDHRQAAKATAWPRAAGGHGASGPGGLRRPAQQRGGLEAEPGGQGL